jgi:uncharacterized protein (DUF2336 family)
MNTEHVERMAKAARQLAPLVPYLPVKALVDLAVIGNEACHDVLARATKVEVPVSAALAEIGDVEEVTMLARNHAAAIAPYSLIRMVERFGSSEALISAVEARDELLGPQNEDVWAALASARLRTVLELMGGSPDQAAIDQAIVALLWASDVRVRASYIASFMRFDQITPRIIKLALTSGAVDVASAILAVLSDISIIDINAMLAQQDRRSFKRLLDIVGLPPSLLDDFTAALAQLDVKPSALRPIAA